MVSSLIFPMKFHFWAGLISYNTVEKSSGSMASPSLDLLDLDHCSPSDVRQGNTLFSISELWVQICSEAKESLVSLEDPL